MQDAETNANKQTNKAYRPSQKSSAQEESMWSPPRNPNLHHHHFTQASPRAGCGDCGKEADGRGVHPRQQRQHQLYRDPLQILRTTPPPPPLGGEREGATKRASGTLSQACDTTRGGQCLALRRIPFQGSAVSRALFLQGPESLNVVQKQILAWGFRTVGGTPPGICYERVLWRGVGGSHTV